MIIVKSLREIEIMREAGKIVGMVFEGLKPMLKPGVSAKELDDEAGRIITEAGGTCPCNGYYGYPANICVSINDTIVHGIPTPNIKLREGDIVSLDVVAKYKGYCADACRTYGVGIISDEAKRLIEVTRESFFKGAALVKPGVALGDISHAIQEYNESHGYSVIREYTGHGIGREMHEDPSIPNYGKAGTGPILKKGMTICIEPMVALGKKDIRILKDGWTTKMKDGKISCHYENTLVVTDDGCEIITFNKELD